MPEGTILHFDKALLIEIAVYMVNILLLVGVLAFLLYKPVKKFLNQRRGRIEDDLSSAKRQLEEAGQLKAKYENLLAGIGEEREEILSQANKRAVERSDELLFEARKEADAIHNRAVAELELERKNAFNDMKEQMIEISALMAGRFVKVSMDRETQDKYIDEAFADWMDEQ
jgi:F-type H+-transporting ATPase subunit b